MPLTLRIIGSRARPLAGRAHHTFGPEGGRIGRAADNDWVLADPERYVSSHHARIVYVEGRYNLLDTSSNGTFVNGSKQAVGRQGAYPLEAGDQIAIGGYELRVEVGPPRDEDLNAALATTPPVPDPAASIPDLGAALDLRDLIAGNAVAENPKPPAINAPPVSGSATQAFQRGAGLAPGAIHSADDQQLLTLAGLLLREMTTGLVAQARLRSQRDDLVDGRTGSFNLRRDPIEHAGSVDEALQLMLDDQQKRLVPPVDAVRAAFSRLETEQKIALDAARQTLKDVLSRLSPATIEQRFGAAEDEASAAHCWRQLSALHERLISEDGLPRTWNNDYAAALRQRSDASE